MNRKGLVSSVQNFKGLLLHSLKKVSLATGYRKKAVLASKDFLITFIVSSTSMSEFAGLSMGHIYLSHSHPIAIYACPVSSHGTFPMGFPWTSLWLSTGHVYLSHSHPIAIYACPIPWDVSMGFP